MILRLQRVLSIRDEDSEPIYKTILPRESGDVHSRNMHLQGCKSEQTAGSPQKLKVLNSIQGYSFIST